MRINLYRRYIKRCLDIILSFLGIIVLSPVMLVTAFFVHIKLGDPVIFKQKRPGKNEKIFEMYKFRSMYMDAEERKKELMKDNRVEDGMMFKLEFDPRVIGNKILPNGEKKTGIGNLIRKTSLDEFPQFLNVLKGVSGIIEPTEKKLDFTGFSLA